MLSKPSSRTMKHEANGSEETYPMWTAYGCSLAGIGWRKQHQTTRCQDRQDKDGETSCQQVVISLGLKLQSCPAA
jgi:hypothetical protein